MLAYCRFAFVIIGLVGAARAADADVITQASQPFMLASAIGPLDLPGPSGAVFNESNEMMGSATFAQFAPSSGKLTDVVLSLSYTARLFALGEVISDGASGVSGLDTLSGYTMTLSIAGNTVFMASGDGAAGCRFDTRGDANQCEVDGAFSEMGAETLTALDLTPFVGTGDIDIGLTLSHSLSGSLINTVTGFVQGNAFSIGEISLDYIFEPDASPISSPPSLVLLVAGLLGLRRLL